MGLLNNSLVLVATVRQKRFPALLWLGEYLKTNTFTVTDYGSDIKRIT